MNTYDFVHLAIHANGGQIQGKTKLQKVVYFLGILTGQDKSLGYRAHFYGPYSGEVAASTDRLKAMGFLNSSTATWGGMDTRGFEIARTDYSLNEDGTLIAKQKAAKYADLWQKLCNGVEMLKQAGNVDYVKLSIAAKTYFLVGAGDPPRTEAEYAQIAEDLGEFNWTVTPEQVREAVGFLEKMQLLNSAARGGA